VGVKKYDRADIRDVLERSSARETAMRVAAGAVAKQFLAALGMNISSRVLNIGGVCADAKKSEGNEASELNCRDGAAEERMKEKIREAKEAGDTLGGIFEVVVTGVPVGLGSHIQWDRRLDAKLAAAMMSIQAVKGVEIGEGFGYAELPGSRAHDEMFYDETGRVVRKTNHAGGLEGGMTNGEPIVLRAVMKPIPTLMQPLHSVDIAARQPVLASKERSDVCAVAAASVVGEAMTAIVVAGAVTEKFGGDAMRDVAEMVRSYRERIGER
jgi:chorismate synthase